MSFGTLTRIDGSAGLPAAGLIVTMHLGTIRQENCTGSRLQPMTDLALQGRLFPGIEKILRSDSGSVHRQTPDLSRWQGRMGPPKGDHSLCEAMDIFVLFQQAPVKPADLVILTIGIIIAALGSAKLIAAEQHGNPARDEQGQKEILDQSVAHALDTGILARPFHPAIVAVVGIRSIAIELAIFGIVFLLVADQVVQCEAVMGGHEVEAAGGALARALVQIRASTKSACERSDHALFANPEAAHIVTETSVPFRPALIGKISHLIRAARVPGFRDNLYVAQDGILGNVFKKRSVEQNSPMLVPSQHGGKVEAKSVNVHVHDPVTEHTRH